MADYVVVDKEQLEADLTTVADSIRGLLETEEKLEFPNGMKEAVDNFSLDKELTEQDSLIEQIKTALHGKASGGLYYEPYICSITGMFSSASFPENYEIVLNIPSFKAEMSNVFATSIGLKKVKIIANTEQLINANSAFNECRTVSSIDLSEMTPNGVLTFKGYSTYMFRRCDMLEEIKGVLNFADSNYAGVFQECHMLKEVRFFEECIKKSIAFERSSLLSIESIQSIIDGLADLTGLETQTLTFHADIKAKLTDEQITTITSKNWTLA